MLELAKHPVDTAPVPVDTAGQVYGIATPRLFTPPLRPLTPDTSLGFDVIAWGIEKLGFHPLPWQETFLKGALEILPNGLPRFSTVLLLVSRQAGKSSVVNLLASYKLAHGTPLILGISSTLDSAQEQWELVAETAEEHPDIFGKVTVRRANGSVQLACELEDGRKSRYKLAAAGRKGGRSLTVHMLLLDEARELLSWESYAAASNATVAVPDALTVLSSNAGDDRSVVLNTLRALALSGEDETIGIFEWSGRDNCPIDSIEDIRMACPSLGYTISLKTILSRSRQQPASVFRTEQLCQSVPTTDEVVNSEEWARTLDPGDLSDCRKRIALCLDVSEDMRHSTLVAAAVLPSGRVRIEVVAAWTSSALMRREIADTVKRVNPRVFGYPSTGPAAAFLTDLGKIPRGKALSGTVMSSAAMGFADLVKAALVAQSGDELLASHVLSAKRRNTGEGWTFMRRDGGHVDAAFAAAGAVHLARLLPRPMNLKMVTAHG